MSKVIAVARAEYLRAVRSKAFIIGLVLMPVFMGGGIVAHALLEDQVDTEDRRCAVADGTGVLFESIAAATADRNENWVFDGEGDDRRQVRPRFLIEEYVPEEGERPDIELSERVDDGELFAFLVIDEAILDPKGRGHGARKLLAYHTENPTFQDLPDFLERTVNDEVVRRRFENAEIDQALVADLSRRVRISSLGLVEVSASGEVEEAEEENKIRTYGVPAASMFLVFMLLMMSVPQMMNEVLEEKMQRIAEVLVSAVSPFQLMLGKIVGTTLVSLTLASLYIGAAAYATWHFGVSDFVPASIYFWILLFHTLALFMFGALFSSLGAACSELRDAQSMAMPAILLLLIPMFTWSVVLQNPSSTFSTVLSLIPPATPMIMLLRIGIPPGPAAWEVILSLVLCIGFTLVCVKMGAKVFRIGILAQGQAPSFRKLVGWVFSK